MGWQRPGLTASRPGAETGHMRTHVRLVPVGAGALWPGLATALALASLPADARSWIGWAESVPGPLPVPAGLVLLLGVTVVIIAGARLGTHRWAYNVEGGDMARVSASGGKGGRGRGGGKGGRGGTAVSHGVDPARIGTLVADGGQGGEGGPNGEPGGDGGDGGFAGIFQSGKRRNRPVTKRLPRFMRR